MLLEGFFLGLSTVWFCFISCFPILAPFLAIQENKKRKDWFFILLFLAGRFIAYMITAVVFSMLGNIASIKFIILKLNPFLYLLIGIFLLVPPLIQNFPSLKFCKKIKPLDKPVLFSFFFGFLSGINICPPLTVAITRVLMAGNIYSGVIFFLSFFSATSLFTLPLFFISTFKKKFEGIQITARIVLILLGFYYIIKALFEICQFLKMLN